ncbi:MAG: valyl-tRNA synthetase [Flavobacteriales bacterium]|jgi:valyl-tRNA synthetase
MEIATKYDPAATEDKWYAYWLEHKYFNSTPDHREAYTVVIPPPNVTGVLHMGHMLNNTIQDVLVRRARMLGKNACWVPGTDHASIATEAKVVHKLREQGIKKSDLSREDFLKHAFEWKDKHGGIILEQLKKLGASCDWDRTSFTMDEKYSESVIDTFLDLFEKGYIYRGVRMVNWDPSALTAVSDEEVIHKEVNGKLYYINYQIENSDELITIATTRPETILGDTAICIHPDDPRFKHLHGKKAIVPMCNRVIPIIADDYVEMDFGTGCLKVTPAHDINDYDLGKKHNLETIDILNANGTLSEAAGFYIGQDRFDVRKAIAKDLKELGALNKVEDYINKVGYSERTDAVIEPRLSLQWFCEMEKLAKPALDRVMDDTIKFYPSKFKNSYRHWMENVKDWCISRQLWWGHQIPAYFYGEGSEDFVVAKTIEEALMKAKIKTGNDNLTSEDLKQDEDVLDTWFSSWLWPISVFNGFYSEEEINYYYPTNDIVTAPEIMFFWVARMIIAGYEYRGEMPFKNVYYTGIVRDQLGRKMSKSLGNSPDPIELMKLYGADGVRVGMLLSSPAGNDLLFESSLCEQGRNFSNKIWNAFRLVKGWEVADIEQPKASQLANQWFEEKFNQTLVLINEAYDKFRMSEALMLTYKLVWDDFCSWYLEMIKPAYQQPIDAVTVAKANEFFESILRILHPFMPFITEELWHLIADRNSPDEALVIASWPTVKAVDDSFLTNMENAMEVISGIRNIRKQNNIPNKIPLTLQVKSNSQMNTSFDAVVAKLGNLEELSYSDEKVANAFSFMLDNNEFFIPFGEEVDVEEEIKKLEEDLHYTKGFLNSVNKKLSNQKFVAGAPEQVVASERKKQEDAANKIKLIEEKLQALKVK